MQGFIIDVGTETEIDQRGGACRMRLVYRLHIVQGVHDGQGTEIAVEIDQVDITRRTLLLHYTLDIRPMSIEVV